MRKVNMIFLFSLILQAFVGSVYSTRTDSTFDQLKETAYNSFGTVKDFAGNSVETIKDTAGDALGTVKNTIWWSSAPSNPPSDAPANAPHHGHPHGPKHHGHHHKFDADSPTPISADDSAGSMDDVKQVHKVTLHTSMHTTWDGVLPGNKAYNDVTGDPKYWGKGFAEAHQHHQKVNSPPKRSTLQERILRKSYKMQPHASSPAPTTQTDAAGHNRPIGRDIHKPAKGAQSPSPISNGVEGKMHNTIHTSMKGIEKPILPITANHKFNDFTGFATATFHDWTNGHGKGASVPTSSAKHNRGLSESHHGKATSEKHSHGPSAAPTVAADHSHQKHKSHDKSPSPVYADAVLHNTIHAAVTHKYDDVTGDATTTFHDWAKDGRFQGTPSPKSSTAHRHVHVLGHGRKLSASHQGKRIHVTIHTGANTAHSQFNDVTGDAASTLRHWTKDGHGTKGTTVHSPKHAPATHHGTPETRERRLRQRVLHHTPLHSGGKLHHVSPVSAPATSPSASPSSTNGQDKEHKGPVHLAVNDNFNTAQATYNDVTGDDVAAYTDWESHRSHGNHQ